MNFTQLYHMENHIKVQHAKWQSHIKSYCVMWHISTNQCGDIIGSLK